MGRRVEVFRHHVGALGDDLAIDDDDPRRTGPPPVSTERSASAMARRMASVSFIGSSPLRPGSRRIWGGCGDGDHGGLLACDAGKADRADDAVDQGLGEAEVAHGFFELRALGFGADQAEIAEVAALEHACAERVVEVVAVGHHQIDRAGGGPRRRRAPDGACSGGVTLAGMVSGYCSGRLFRPG